MGLLGERTYDYTKEHKELDHKDGWVICTWCGKELEECETLPDYYGFMGGVWAKQNLPCKPYPTHKPTTEGK